MAIIVKRKNFLINPKFQMKFSLYVAILVFISSLIYPITIYDLMQSFIDFLSKGRPGASDLLAGKRTSLIQILAIWQVGFTFLVFVVCIFFSHRIAGPLYKLQLTLEKFRKDGFVKQKLFFRSGDYFKEIADDFNKTFESINERENKLAQSIVEINKNLNDLKAGLDDQKISSIDSISQSLNELVLKNEESTSDDKAEDSSTNQETNT